MEKEGDNGYYNSEGTFIEAPKKQFFRLQVPYSLRFAIVWTLFFIIIGIIIQSIKANIFIFKDFFIENYFQWFRDFGAFTDIVIYPDVNSIIVAILEKWYYFFYTGGLLSLIWGILSWIIHFEMVVKKRPTISRKLQQQSLLAQKPQPQQEPEPQQNTPEFIKPSFIPQEIQSISLLQAPMIPSSSLIQTKIIEWLEAGLLLLSEGNIEEAELVYEQIAREYDVNQDIDQHIYKRILDFYYEIFARKQQKQQ